MELFTPDFGLIFWMFVSFAILFVVLWRWGWPAIIKGVSDRADLIDKGVGLTVSIQNFRITVAYSQCRHRL